MCFKNPLSVEEGGAAEAGKKSEESTTTKPDKGKHSKQQQQCIVCKKVRSLIPSLIRLVFQFSVYSRQLKFITCNLNHINEYILWLSFSPVLIENDF